MTERHRNKRDSEEPDATYEEYENNEDERRKSLEREAGLTSFGGPALGPLFGAADGDDGEVFDAEHNP